MMNPESKQRRVINVSEGIPQPGKWVIVITPSYRCMGYLDDQGVWKDVHRNQVIEGVQAWSPTGEEETIRFTQKSGEDNRPPVGA